MTKERVTVEIEAEVLARLREAGLDVAAVIDREVRRRAAAVEGPDQRRARLDQWTQENRAAIDAYNKEIDERGVFGEDMRGW